MAGVRGRDVVIRVSDGGSPVAYDEIAGIRARTITLSARQVEATTAQSPQAWRELIAGAATKRIEVIGSGWFWSRWADERLRAAYFAGETPRFQIAVLDFGVFEGPFAIVELTYDGEEDGMALFSIRLASAGPVSFSAS
jgi:TP901-1 family phage major tail protein